MSARSFRLELAACCALVACKHPPEADPAQVVTLAANMLDHSPVPSAAPQCKGADLSAPVTVTFRALRMIAGQTPSADPTEADWINPTSLDSPGIATLIDTKGDITAKRRAAAELLAANAWIVYRVDLVNAPMALGVKELKIGTIMMRIIRYDRASAQPSCVLVFNFQNTQERSDWAISVSNRPYIDPEVQRILREDLAAQYVKLLPHAPPAPKS